ncbi:probable ubiquinone/menaquinone biosynthesis C-methyltransferase Ub at C-terminar half [Coccomyxa sp. Obi]|nr:probable ubiquinone/menaquinone biosynthesis C-methyltransferase Ub at C-terminar half [Coccomyxa sp. Obi]
MQSSRRLVYPAMGIYALGTYGAFLYFRSRQPYKGELGAGRTWDEIADSYDGELGLDETLMGIKLLRRWLVRKAEGDVLEVSAGTGRNLPYYRYDQLKSLTLTDSSKYMLWHASQKYRDRQAAKGSSLPVCFFLSNAENLSDPQPAAAVPRSASDSPRQPPDVGPPAEAPQSGQQSQVSGVFATRTHAYPENSFDTVVDTFGLCSHGDPVQALKEMGRLCKPEGRILLLEHGKASPDWLNKWLDEGAHKHLMKWGCQWNRDIESIVKEAGLEIELLSRWHFGTTYVIIARPPA